MAKLRLNLFRIGLAIVVLSLVGFSASAQETKLTKKDVPAAVINAFKSAYPTATIKGYARETEYGKTFYEIESKEGDTGRDVLYNPDGTVAEIEETVAPVDLPTAAGELIRSRYSGAVVTKAEKTIKGEKIAYEVIVRQGKHRIALEFDAAGNLIKKGK